jgi:hypothetical protein
VLLVAAAMGLINQVLADEPGVTFITGTLVRLGLGGTGGAGRTDRTGASLFRRGCSTAIAP